MIPTNHPHHGPPGRLGIWGTPWHGLVTSGSMALPNATERLYTAGTEGDVIAFRPPGTLPVVRTPSGAAVDAQSGYQWYDYALITGRTQRRLYGRVIGIHGAWLYAAPTGSRWLMQIDELPAASKDVTAPWALTITATRFGDIATGTVITGEYGALGTATEQHTLTCTLADWQQDIAGKAGGDYSLSGVSGAVTTCAVWLEDASLSGAKAVLMVGLGYPADTVRRRSTGFLEITLTGTPGVDGMATIAVARTRAQTLGAVTYVEAGALVNKYINAGIESVRVQDGNPPACDEAIIRHDFPIDLGLSDGGSWQVQFGTMTRTATMTDRIIAMTYDDEELVPTTISASNVATDSAGAPVFAGSGVRIGTQGNSGEVSPDGTCRATQGYTQSSDTMRWEYTSNLNSTAECTLTVSRGQTSVTLEGYETALIEETQVAVNSSGRPRLSGWPTGPFTWRRVYGDHIDEISDTSTHQIPPDSGQLIVVFSPIELASMSLGIGYGAAADGFFADRVVSVGNGNFATPKIRHAVQRYSNRLVDLVVNPLNDSNQPTSWDYLGAVGGAATGGKILSQPAELAYGSVQPMTGAVARASAVPVVWA